MTRVMSPRMRLVLGALAFVCLSVAASTAAHAQCCPGYTLATACAGQTLAKSRWCIQDTAPTHQAALPAAFCPYGDKVVSTLEEVFNIKAPDTFELELDTQTGGAHTGTSCGHLGDGVAYDAFAGDAYGTTGFWGYLLSMHEAINDWTGMASGGWPTDWWADHQSAFPNLMDFHIMNTIGVANNDQNLVKGAAAQKKRFYPNGDSSDAKVVALDNVYALMPGGDGFAGFSHMFSMQTADGIKWDNLGVANPDVKRSEYVVAYMSLATGQSVLKTLQGPSANAGGKICNGTPDGTPTDAPYTCSDTTVNAIATAHCAANANGKKAADMQALRSGNYANVASGPCGSTCPSECACDGQNHCVAVWLGAKPATDAGVPATGAAGTSGTTGTGTAGTVGGTAGGTAGTTGAAGTTSTVGGAGTGGGTATGAAGTDAGGAGNVGSATGTGGTPTLPIMTGGAGTSGIDTTGGSTGCTCALGTGLDEDKMPAWLSLSVFAVTVLFRRRRARR
jgi:hypothetical protein